MGNGLPLIACFQVQLGYLVVAVADQVGAIREIHNHDNKEVGLFKGYQPSCTNPVSAGMRGLATVRVLVRYLVCYAWCRNFAMAAVAADNRNTAPIGLYQTLIDSVWMDESHIEERRSECLTAVSLSNPHVRMSAFLTTGPAYSESWWHPLAGGPAYQCLTHDGA